MASDRVKLCPHCLLPLESAAAGAWPPSTIRCPHCRLTIGPGRARSGSDPSPGTRGSAAGVYASRARADGGPRATPEEVRAGIRSAAQALGSPPERLLMVDYLKRAADDPSLPDLSAVLAAFGSWKSARREARAAAD